MHRPRDLLPSQDDSPLSIFRMAYEQWEVAPSWCQMLTWSITDGLLQPDQIMSRSSKVLATSTLTCPFHPPSISPPAPFHPWTKLMLSPCYSPVSDMPPCLWDTMAPRRHINVAIVDKYVCAKAATVKRRWRHFCLQMAAILSTFWHPCRLGISQNEVDFYVVLKIGPC